VSNKFQFGGRPRMPHQIKGLKFLIEKKGIGALFWDPGVGKTAPTWDYLSVLALKSPAQEVRVLVVAPIAAVDTWVNQAKEWASPQVSVWAEVVGGSIRQKGDTLAVRAGNPRKRGKGDSRAFQSRGDGLGRAQVFWARGPSGGGDLRVLSPDDLPGPRVILCAVNIDAFSSRAAWGSRTMADYMLESVKRFQPEVAVVDESHLIKGTSSNTSSLLGRIGKHVPRRIILTGTPMPNGPLDIYGQWRFLAPQAFSKHVGSPRDTTYGDFEERYARKGGYMGKQVMGYQNLDELRRVVAENAMVVRKRDALKDLPSYTDNVVPVHLSPKEQRAYDEMKKNLAVEFAGEVIIAGNRLAQAMRLRQITSGYLPAKDGGEELGGSKTKAITSIVNETLIGENRVIVFVNFSRDIQNLQKSIGRDKNTRVEIISGGVPADKRIEIRERFGNTRKHPERIVLVAQISTVSMSINEFVTASHAVFGSLTQRRDDHVQARDRLHRNGQTRPVTFWYALAPGTVDEVIFDAYLKKTSLEAGILKHIREAG